MPRLPDATALGGRPAIETQTPVVNEPGGAYLRQTTQIQGQTDAAIGQDLAQMGQQFAQAQAKVRTRQDAVNAAQAETAFTAAIDAEFNRITTEADIADEKTIKGYGEFAGKQMQDFVGNYGGSEEGRNMLAARLDGIRGTYARKAGMASFEAGQKRVTKLLGDDINGYSAAASENPAALPELFRAFDARLETMGPAITPETEAEYRSTARRTMVLAGVNSFLERGDVDNAQSLLDGTPGVMRILTPDDQSKLRKSIQEINTQRNKGIIEAKTKLDVFKALNGREPNAMERLDLSGVTAGNPQSPVGKALADIETFSRQYGPNSPQVAALKTALTNDLKKPENAASLSAESAFRAQFQSESRPFVTVRDAFARIAAAAESATPAGDLALIYNFARMLDPNGAVRDQDFQQIAATGGFGAQIQGYMAQVQGQGRLAPAVRADLLNQSKGLMQAQIKSQLSLESQYKQIAVRSGYALDNVLDNLGEYRNYVETKAPPTPKVGEVVDGYRYKGGDLAQPESWEEVKPPMDRGGTL